MKKFYLFTTSSKYLQAVHNENDDFETILEEIWVLNGDVESKRIIIQHFETGKYYELIIERVAFESSLYIPNLQAREVVKESIVTCIWK